MIDHKGNEYRPDIDGLRAAAVLLVIGFHAFPEIVPGGFVGVDVFFVISGYLITQIVLKDIARKQFSFADFYARRIRRIFPSLIVVLLGCLIAGWFILLPSDFASLGLNVFGGAAFTSNFVLLGQTGYFDTAAIQKPLLHLWSLGIEEQFYIVWPAVALVAFRFRMPAAGVAVLLALMSFALSVAVMGTPRDFYLPTTRSWELMVGCALAAGYRKPFFNATVTNIVGAIGILLIVSAAAFFNGRMPFPGWLALLPTIGTGLVIISGESWLNRSALGNRAAAAIGLVSYPLYLWHWPLLSFAATLSPSGVPSIYRAALVVLSGILSFLTYRWVEIPLRFGGGRKLKIVALCTAMISLGVSGLAIYHWKGVASRMPDVLRMATETKNTEDFRRREWRMHKCLLDVGEVKYAPECTDAARRPLLVLWGDSYAGSLSPGLRHLQSDIVFGFDQITMVQCPPVLNFDVHGNPGCRRNNDDVLNQISALKPDIVLLFSAWHPIAYGDFYPNLRETVKRLREIGVERIVIMGTLPGWAGGLPKAYVDYYRMSGLRGMLPERSPFRLETWNVYQERFHREAQQIAGTEYISAWDAFCTSAGCLTRVGGQLTTFDDAHLTPAGADYLARAIAPCLFGPPSARPEAVCGQH